MFRIPAIRLAEARQGAAATYMYQFNWRSRAFDGALAATHSLEIPFAFDNLDQAGVDFFWARAIASGTGGYHAQSLV